MTSPDSVLVIVTGGLGHFVQMLGALSALRIHHRTDRITLLTTAEAADFAVASRLVDDVVCEPDFAWWDITALWRFRQHLRAMSFPHVYDLDGGARGKRFLHLIHGFGPAPATWCGDADDARGQTAHVCDRIEAQLLRAGIPEIPAADLTWVARHVTSFKAPFRMDQPFVLIAADPPDTHAGHGRHWPTERWAAVGEAVAEARAVPLLVGLKPAPELREALANRAPRTVDLTGHATVSDLVFLAWGARGAVGTDNSLMHLCAAAGCRSVVLYDQLSDPARHGQRGRNVTILRRKTLGDIPVGEVVAALRPLR